MGRIRDDVQEVLWRRGASTPHEVYQTLARSYPLDRSAVCHELRRMHKRGAVERREVVREGKRQPVYEMLLMPPECTGDVVVHYILDRLIADHPDAVRAYLAQRPDLFGCVCDAIEHKPGSRMVYTCPVHGVLQK